MKTNRFSQYAFMVVLTIFLSVSTLEAQWFNDPLGGGVPNTNITTNMYRNANVGIGAKNPQSSAIKLYVNGRIGQRSTGTFGGFGSNDQWSSLGSSFGPSNIAQTYGLIRQWGGASFISGVKDKTHGLVSWAGNGRLDFDYINSSNVNSTKMSILSNGNVGIGTAAPNFNLDVRGTTSLQYLYPNLDDGNPYRYIRFGSPSQFWAGFMWNNNSSGYGNGDDFTIFTYNSRDIVLTPGNGNVILGLTSSSQTAVGTTNPGSFKFYVNGTTGCSQGFWAGSDKRYKKDIKKIDGALEKIKAVDGFTYQFKREIINDLDFTQATESNQLGFLAQDLEKVFPELVQKDDAGFYTVNYDGMVPVLVEALKDQNSVVEGQKEEINNQKEEINNLSEKVDRLETQLSTVLEAINALQGDTGQTIDLGSTTNETVMPTATLSPNRPNPVNGRTTIDYSIEQDHAQLVVYDLTGNILNTYELAKGEGSIEFDAAGLMNGTYIYAIVANGQTVAQQKMVIQK